jgi:hypothetical protein
MTYLLNVLNIDMISIYLVGLHLNYEHFCVDIFKPFAKNYGHASHEN